MPLNATVRPKYGKEAVDYSGSRLTHIVNLLASEQCCSVSLLSVVTLREGNFLLCSVDFLGAKVAPDIQFSHSGEKLRGVTPG